MILTLIAVNTLGWLVLQLSIAAAAVRMDSRSFADDNWFYRVRTGEIEFYKRWLHIRRWKNSLPDGAPWVGGSFRKKTLLGRDSAYLAQLLIETRRGEAAHWLMLVSFPIFFLWNPPWVWTVMALYAAAANLPCIIVQRYNREAAQRLQLRRNTHFPSDSCSPPSGSAGRRLPC
jgi:glycosyl-4,4'-diaponeurosporenoate acyltransferase